MTKAAHKVTHSRAVVFYRRRMDAEHQVAERLDRIEALRSLGGAPGELLSELRGLLRAGEAWLAAERGGGEAAGSPTGVAAIHAERRP